MGLTDDDQRDLRELAVRYASAVDRRAFDELREVFTEDAVLVTLVGERRGREDILGAMAGLERYDRTFHLLGQSRHWVEGDEVRGETYCLAHHFNVDPDGGTRDRVMYIRYLDTYEWADGGWRVSRRELDGVWSGQEDKPG